MLIEQAIFAPAHPDQTAGYQLLARSPGVTDRQARELAVWGPSHDALNPQRDEPSSVNFNVLPCGTYCVSKTVATGQKYSSRGGARIYTQFLLVPAAVLARFANNPFAVLRAAWAKGVLTVQEQPPPALEPLTLVGRSTKVDEGLLAQLADQWGPQRVARLVTAAMSPGVQLLTGATQCETLLGGLLQCFPVECRTELTFTTGLRFSPLRPFRLSPLSDDAAEQQRAAKQEDAILVDLSENLRAESEPTGWAAYVAEAIRCDQLSRLATALQQPRPSLKMNELNTLGEQLLEELRREPVTAATSLDEINAEDCASQPQSSASSGRERLFRTDRPVTPRGREKNSDPHQPREKLSAAANRAPGVSFVAGSGSQLHTLTDPETVEVLEQLDDTVYEAVNAVEGAVEKVAELWVQLAQRLPSPALAALREQYLQYALTLWDASHEQGVRDAHKAIGALDVLAVLFKAE